MSNMVIIWLSICYCGIQIETKTKSVQFCGFTPGLGSERDGFHLVIGSEKGAGARMDVFENGVYCTLPNSHFNGENSGTPDFGSHGMPQVSFPWLRADWSCLGIPRTSRQCTFGRIPGFRAFNDAVS